MAYLPGQPTPRNVVGRSRRAAWVLGVTNSRRKLIAVGIGGVALLMAVMFFVVAEPDELTVVDTPTRASELAATASARANLETAIAEAAAQLTATTPDSSTAVLSTAIDDCTTLTNAADADIQALRDCELKVRTAAAVTVAP